MTATDRKRWPSIPVADWQDTRDTLHLYTQVVGKTRMANDPLANHWWNIPLYVSARGLTTSLMPHPTGPAFQIDFDFLDHRLDITTVTGQRRSLDLGPRPAAEFYAATRPRTGTAPPSNDRTEKPVADTCTHLDTVRDITPSSDHPLIRSHEPGEDWWWRYADDLFFDVDGAPPSPSP